MKEDNIQNKKLLFFEPESLYIALCDLELLTYVDQASLELTKTLSASASQALGLKVGIRMPSFFFFKPQCRQNIYSVKNQLLRAGEVLTR